MHFFTFLNLIAANMECNGVKQRAGANPSMKCKLCFSKKKNRFFVFLESRFGGI